MNPNVFSVKIGGEAGQGIKSSGLLFAKFVSRSGYNLYTYIEFPSLIKGGHNVMQINIDTDEVLGPSVYTDFVVALNKQTIELHLTELRPGAVIICDESVKLDNISVPQGTEIIPLPLLKISHELVKSTLLINTVALGAAAALLGGELEIMKTLVAEEYGHKKEEIILANQQAVQNGFEFIKNNFSSKIKNTLQKREDNNTMIPKIVISGTETAALGALAGGMQFAAIYPMSPISGILHILAKYQGQFKYVYKQPEDELAAINMAIGASFAGVRSLTSTSGGGFALMSEAYGLAGITETPLVIIEGMRGGPATGLPTWNEQGDLRFVLHAHQSDFPRIVLAAGDAQEMFNLTAAAFNLADKYQTTVLILTDKNIVENYQTYLSFDSTFEIDRGKFLTQKTEDYQRYALSEDGVSVRSIPGVGNHFVANSDEHDFTGYSSEDIKVRNEQMSKRMKKLETCAQQDMQAPILFGPQEADVTIISWGSNKGSILQALKHVRNVNYLHVTWMSPFPTQQVKTVLSKAKYILNIECNYTAQFGGLLKEKTCIEPHENFLKYDGRPFFVEEIVEKLQEILKGN